jgi:hypothetical protein
MPSTQVRQTPTTVDPIAALIAAHAPTNPAEILRPLPTPSEAAQADSLRRRAQSRHDRVGLPRHLVGVDALRCGDYF